ncbi:MAG: septum site-determining protein MinC [Burkholderiales bacterium]|nr:septum site-determining protein MinC [Burkholderiales bacterium]MDE2433977.1 septum site-determining protein MinC [Burkholderiales bacterium]HET8694155.1 septum site-determining protein MinC [Aquabacterium sp.]
MSATSANANALFDLKSASLTLVAFVLKTGNMQALEQALTEKFGDTPDFFSHDPVVVDLTPLSSLEVATLNFPALIELLKRFRLTPVAVRGGNAKQMADALEAGLGEAPESSTPRQQAVQEVVKEVIREVPVEVRVEVPVSSATMIIDKPLRSGQQVYAKGGDLIVMAVVNHGAEVIADGSIHVYAPLRGKAIAGAKGNPEARIFSTSMEPELVSIAGTYRTTETPLPPEVLGKPAQIRLDGERLVYEAIKI